MPRVLSGRRGRSINNLERHLLANKTRIVKIFLNLSSEEQRKRLLARLKPRKNWKFSEGDIHEREFWDQYQKAYEEMIRHTSSRDAPWYVVPADNSGIQACLHVRHCEHWRK
ncbi:MAG: hypothetical protein ACLT8E_08915 [Akkermansia sp.]